MHVAAEIGTKKGLTLYVPFTKVEPQDDGSVIVEGLATCEELDKQGEVVTYAASKKAFANWTEAFSEVTKGASLGNIREMHGPIAAGKAIAWWADDEKKAIGLRSKIVDPEAAKKCKESVYTGYSIGGAPGTVKREIRKFDGKNVPAVTAYELSETSVVDNPAAPSAVFTLVKRAPARPWELDPEKTAKAFGGGAVPAPTLISWTPSLLKSELAAGRGAAVCDLLNKTVVRDLRTGPDYPDPDPDPEPEIIGDTIDKAIADGERVHAALEAGSLKKSLYDVGTLASLLSSLKYLRQSCVAEAAYEGDAPDFLPNLVRCTNDLGNVLVAMVQHEVDELKTLPDGGELEMAMNAEEITKLLKQSFSENLAGLVTKDDLKKVVEDTTKAVGASLTPKIEALEKTASDLKTENAALKKDLETVKATPAAPLTAGKVEEKTIAGSGAATKTLLGPDQAVAFIKSLGLAPEQEHAALMASAQKFVPAHGSK